MPHIPKCFADYCDDRRFVDRWETIADNLSTGRLALRLYLNYGSQRATVVAAEREDAGRFIVHADEVLTAFLALQAAIRRRFELG